MNAGARTEREACERRCAVLRSIHRDEAFHVMWNGEGAVPDIEFDPVHVYETPVNDAKDSSRGTFESREAVGLPSRRSS